MAKPKHSARWPLTFGRPFDMQFLILLLVLLTIGLVMLFSASYPSAYYYEGNGYHYIVRQAFFAIAGLVVMLGISFLDYHVIRPFRWFIWGAVFLLLGIVLILPAQSGVHRWITIGPVQFQPSELMKFAMVVMLAHLISRNYQKMRSIKEGILPILGFLIVTIGIIAVEPHMSASILMFAMALVMLWVGGMRAIILPVMAGVGAVGLAGIVAIKGVSYVGVRLSGWLNPTADNAYQTYQSILTIGSGGLLGRGLGQSRQKFLYLPEAQNDFIFAVVCEELGLIGALVIIVLFLLLIIRGFVIASRAPDRFGMLLAVGLTAQIGLQAFANIGVVSGLLPNTGISLPFFSYGGTALFMQLVEMGILLNISRQAVKKEVT